jgi:hypothetical protein
MHQSLVSGLVSTYFVMSPGWPFVQAEKNHFGCARWSHKGTRQMIVTREENLLQFVRSQLSLAQYVPFQNLWATFKAFTAEQVASFVQGQGKDAVWTATAGPGDLVITPPACVISESAQAESNVGLRIPVLRKSDHKDLMKVQAHLDAAPVLVQPGVPAASQAVPKQTVLKLALEAPLLCIVFSSFSP